MKKRNFILQWSNNYQFVFQTSRLVSQIPAFILTVTAICEIGWIFYAISKAENVAWEVAASALVFQFSIAFLGMLRFLLLFSKSKITFWISQLVWLACFLLLLTDVSNRSNITSNGVYYYYPFYIFFSAIRQIVTLAVSFIKLRK